VIRPFEKNHVPGNFFGTFNDNKKNRLSSIPIFVRTDIDHNNRGPALIRTIENRPLLEHDPEQPETFQDSAQ
jgi:hypothetical protein